MSTQIFVKKENDCLVPVDQANLLLIDELDGTYKAVLTKPRNIQFHRKFFALVNIAFDAWQTDSIKHKGVIVKKNRDRFRRELTIHAGYYSAVFNINNELRLEAKSISFSNMEEEEFSKLYSKVIDVILQKILTNYSKSDLEEQVQKVLEFC